MVTEGKKMGILSYNKKNVGAARKMRGRSKKIYEEDLELDRTHKFKKWGKNDKNAHGTGRLVKRKRPLKKFRF